MTCIKKDSQSHKTGYKNQGCRCDLCTAAHCAYGKAYRSTPQGHARYLARNKAYAQTPKEIARHAAYRNSPEGKAYHNARSKAFDKSPKGKARQGVRNAAYRSAKINSFAELTDHDRKLMFMIWKIRPTGYQVDHIHPLSKGGLDTPMNLQYLSASDNRRKNNKLDYVPQDRVIQWYELIDPLTGDARE